MTENNKTAPAPFNIKIPGYQIKRLLGKGGMASVYLAVQESFGRDVAIKVLSPDMALDKEFSQRFLREAQIVSRLQHPNIVTVHDVGIHEGYHYLSMEYVPGKELREAKYDISKTEAIRIVKEVAKALDYAHKQGYIHRDVKPENIMLHDNGERVVLMDFGIARMTQTSNSVTKTGKVIGTPHYMSPEQTKGLPVDHRSDIYSLGVVLFQMLSGRLPYDAESPIAVGIKHISDPIPSMPPGLEIFQPIINTCMSKSPDHRYQSAAEFIEALDSLNMNAVSVLDARASAKQAKDKIVHNPDSATMVGTAMLDDDTVIPPGKPHYNIPPLVHPNPRKYLDEETAIQDKAGSRSGSKTFLLFLLLLLGGSVWAYFNQPRVFQFWEKKIQPEVMRLAIQYELLPAPVKSKPAETTTDEIQAPQAETPITETSQLISDSPVDKASEKTSLVTDKAAETVDTVTVENNVVEKTIDLQQLKAGLQQHPENALQIAEYYKEELKNNTGNLAARNGLAELHDWYKFEMRSAMENKDLVRMRLLANQLQESFPRIAEQPRFHSMITRLAQAETIQKHLDNAASYLAKDILTEPVGANALAEYKVVLALSPKHPDAINGINKIRDIAYQKATYFQGRGEFKVALAYVNAGLMAVPLDKELKAIKDKIGSRVERTSRHDTLNKQAEILFRSGNLIVPKGQSAYDKYSEVLKENPNNLVARSGIRKIEKHLVDYAVIYLEENDLEKAEGIIKAAKEKFGATPIIEEVQYKINKALKAVAPKIRQVLFSATKPASLSDMTSQPIKLHKVLHVGLVYENFKTANMVLEANLVDKSGRTLITSKKITLSDTQGESIFSMTLPTKQLANDSYKLELILGANKLIVASFINDNTLP